MSKIQDEKCYDLLEAQTHVWNHIFSYINSAVLKCAVELGIPDAIHNYGKAMTINELVLSLSINKAKAPCLSRLMRTLVHSGFFNQQKTEKPGSIEKEEAYSLTPTSRLFLKEEPLNQIMYLAVKLHPLALQPWHSLGEWFNNDDRDAFTTAHGMPIPEFGIKEPVLTEIFSAAMAADSQLTAYFLMNTECAEVFDGLRSLVDVAGGTGTMAKAIARRFPNTKCTVLEIPEVIGDLKGSENLDFVVGDMFVSIPPANAILLKCVLHNWDDEECLKILKNCKESLTQHGNQHGKLIIIDMVVEKKENKEHCYQSQLYYDMLMMVTLKGKERDEGEWAKLFSDTGFSTYKITPALGSRSIIEVYP